MAEAVRIKGSSLVSKLDYVGRRFGAEARQHIEERLTSRFMAPILASLWYPFELYVELLDAIVAKHLDGNPEALREMGADSADQALHGMYQSFLRDRFEHFLDGLPQLHRMLYDKGEMSIRRSPEGSACDIQIQTDCDSSADCLLTAGFYQRAAELHGCQHVRCQVGRQPGMVKYALSWARQAST